MFAAVAGQPSLVGLLDVLHLPDESLVQLLSSNSLPFLKIDDLDVFSFLLQLTCQNRLASLHLQPVQIQLLKSVSQRLVVQPRNLHPGSDRLSRPEKLLLKRGRLGDRRVELEQRIVRVDGFGGQGQVASRAVAVEVS